MLRTERMDAVDACLGVEGQGTQGRLPCSEARGLPSEKGCCLQKAAE